MKKSSSDGTANLDAARAAKERVRSLLAHGGEAAAVGVARRPDGYAVLVTLRRPMQPEALPAEISGVPVEVRVSPSAVAHGG